MMRVKRLPPPAILFLSVLAAACGDDGTSPGGQARVEVRFRTGTAARSSATVAGSSALARGLVVEGGNGILELTEIRTIVDEFELKGEGPECPLDDDDDGGGERKCKFESDPFFLNLPLNGSVTVASEVIPDGAYDRLEFEVEDAELDEGEDDGRLNRLAAEVRALVPDWPDEASMMVAGTFTPAGGGEPRPFRVFFEAEIEVKMALVPPFRVAGGEGDRALTVEVRPDVWFKRVDGSVLDLSLFDFDATGGLLEFDLEMKRGFTEVEID